MLFLHLKISVLCLSARVQVTMSFAFALCCLSVSVGDGAGGGGAWCKQADEVASRLIKTGPIRMDQIGVINKPVANFPVQ